MAGSLTAFAVLGMLWLVSAAGSAPVPSKIQGVVFTGPVSAPLDEETFASMREVGATHVALVPEATVDPDTLEVRHPRRQRYGETREATVEGIRLARAAGLEVMIKPHLEVGRSRSDRIGRGVWRGDFDVEDEAEWPRFAASYRELVLPWLLHDRRRRPGQRLRGHLSDRLERALDAGDLRLALVPPGR